MDIADIREILAEMAELDPDLPFQAFSASLRNAALSDEEHEDVLMALSMQCQSFLEDQDEYYQKVYSGSIV